MPQHGNSATRLHSCDGFDCRQKALTALRVASTTTRPNFFLDRRPLQPCRLSALPTASLERSSSNLTSIMKGFSFPPPPPPPPRATSQDGNPGGNAQPGGHGYRSARGGADRGRGRGRGRGSNHRGGHSGPRNNNHASMTGGFQPQNHYNGHALPSNAQQHQSQPFLPYGSPANFNALPTGGFINPAFTSAYTNYVNTNPLASSWNPATAQQQQQSFPLNTNAIANNSVNSSVGPLQGSNRPLQSKPKPTSKPKVAAPPVVPSFGFQLPTVKPELPTESPSNKSKKRKFNQLGLTPRGDVHEDSEEDDANEEAKFTTGV